PRSGLARRFGERLLDELDRARGVRPDPRDSIRLPDIFASRLELFARADTTLEIALAEPSRDIAHLLVLLRERLARLQLAAPTLELRLHCDDIERRPPPS